MLSEAKRGKFPLQNHPITPMFTIITIIVVALVATFAVLCRYAPRGEENAEGFHPEKAAAREAQEVPSWLHLLFRRIGFAKTKTRD